ncbi:hypothetical protein LMG33818_001534 [Halomonadaceae bacterium LMG 33818]|uniref:TIGR02444 family protein n=1 Tax=Cernens ardua TaxID=3402176 RepID=UPI003EDC075F
MTISSGSDGVSSTTLSPNDIPEKDAIDEQRVSALWQFALRLYSLPGVSATALTLQDEAGIDVPELLWLCWLERHQESPISLEPLQDVHEWQRQITARLRELRRCLKPVSEAEPRLLPLRQKIKDAELEAEKETLHQLALIPWKKEIPNESLWAQWQGTLGEKYEKMIETIREKALTL